MAEPKLTPLMRLTLAGTLGIFLLGAIVLTAIVPNLYVIGRRAKQVEYAALADVCASLVVADEGRNPPTLQSRLDQLRAQYGIEGITIVEPKRTVISGIAGGPGETRRELRTAAGHEIEILFTDSAMPALVRIGKTVAIGAGVATIAGVVVLALTILRALGNSDDLRGSARNTSSAPAAPAYLIETFETSIRTLRGRESELKQLHSREKERADALATITETLVRSLSSGFISIDERGDVLDMNQAARELLGTATAPPYTGGIVDVLGPTPFAQVLQGAIDAKATLQRVEITDENAIARTIGLTTVPLLDASERSFGMLALFTDLTPVRQLETRVREMQSLADLGEMSAGIAHEFRNSLSTVLGYLKLARKSSLSTEADDRIRSAETEAKLLTAAVESLLTFARPMTLQTTELDLDELLRDFASRLQPLNRSIAIDVRGGAFPIEGDAVLLGRAFENLLRNAVEAIDERGGSGHVVVTLDASDRSITIADDGVGIDDAQAAKLFLPFQSTKPNGFGLGLALTKKIVILHGGTIRMSGRRGAGTTVTIDLAPIEI